MRGVRVANLSRIAISIRCTATIKVIGHHVPIFVEAIAAFGNVVIAGAAIFVGTIDLPVAVVINAIRAGTGTKFGLPRTTQIARTAISKRQTIGIRAIDVPIAIVVFAVIAHFHRIRFNEHVKRERAFIGTHIGIDRVAIEEYVIRSGVQQGKVDFRRPLHTTTVIVARNFFACIAFARANIQHRIE